MSVVAAVVVVVSPSVVLAAEAEGSESVDERSWSLTGEAGEDVDAMVI